MMTLYGGYKHIKTRGEKLISARVSKKKMGGKRKYKKSVGTRKRHSRRK